MAMLENVTGEVTLGSSKTAPEWRRRVLVKDLLPRLTRSPEGEKDGQCFTPAVFRGTRRTKSDADQITMVVLDSDCGHELYEIAAAIDVAGYQSFIHSTHSHLITQTEVKCSDLKSSDDGVAHMLEKGFLPRIVQNARITGVSEDGKSHIVEHAPCPKFRILIPLATPWRADAYESQDIANLAWHDFTRALAASLGLSTDQSCCDTSRLFFFPRTRKGGPEFKYWFTAGRRCDMQEVLAVAPDAPSRPNGQGANFEDGALLAWAANFGPVFEIASALRTQKPEVIIRPNGAKTTIQCPFEREHSTPGGEGCFAVNASDLPRAELPSIKSGFVVKCLHKACAGRDRLTFVAEMLEQGWLTEEDLTAPEFLVAGAPGKGTQA
jgi:hypothetical protein